MVTFEQLVESDPIHSREIDALRKLQRGSQIIYGYRAGIKKSTSKDEKKYLEYYGCESWEELACEFATTVEEAKKGMLVTYDEFVDHWGDIIGVHELVDDHAAYHAIFYRENWWNVPTPLIQYSKVLKGDELELYLKTCERFGIAPR